MRVAKTLWFAVSLILTLAALALIAAPQLYLIILWDMTLRRDGYRRRDRVSRWSLWWADVLWTMFSTMMRIRTTMRYPETNGHPAPAIVISNHRSSIDVVLLPMLLHRMGYRRIAPIVKREVQRFPIVGSATKQMRAGFVARSKDPDDLERIRVCAENARDDGACILIFPEGTVLLCGKHKGDYEQVLVPKTAGLTVIRETLPHWPVLSVTLDWGDIKGATSIYTAWTMFGGSITIDARFLDDISGRPVADWLHKEWDRKERELADASAGRLLRKIKRIREKLKERNA